MILTLEQQPCTNYRLVVHNYDGEFLEAKFVINSDLMDVIELGKLKKNLENIVQEITIIIEREVKK